MLLTGVARQISLTVQPSKITPPSSEDGPAKLSAALAWEAIVAKDGKTNIAVSADGVLGVEARYYSKHPERYAFVMTPNMGVIGRVHQNVAKYHPMRFWSLEDLRAAARTTALFDPSDEMIQSMIDAGLHVKTLKSKKFEVVYLE